ncbi:MAG: ABC transporter ATP-binding protein [Acidimicrobiales bacterium]|nr:ABC transporter ATP-binding protein [Acidimicrobiales bacterium]HRW38504.1 ABC transporter ATP-binding protein [Aquihabitans sp.]
MPSTSEFTDADRRARPPAIEVDDVSAAYQVRLDADSVGGSVRTLLRREEATVRVVPALQGVTLDVPQGTVLGVIGRNGAGKSTLLRTMAGILAPSKGRVVVRGRISALLSVGVGMSEALTGRENIRLGGLAVGISEERLEELADDIAEFAQLGEYVDFPVRTYSSGMRSRLGFSVAAHLDPEILLIDEALTGGDAKFKEKTADKMFDLCGDGRTIVLVSHGLSLVRMIATKTVWLHQGKIVEYGDPDDVVSSYMRYCRLESMSMDWED